MAMTLSDIRDAVADARAMTARIYVHIPYAASDAIERLCVIVEKQADIIELLQHTNRALRDRMEALMAKGVSDGEASV